MLPTSHPSGHGLLLGNFMGEATQSVPQPSASGCRAALTSQFAKQMSCPALQLYLPPGPPACHHQPPRGHCIFAPGQAKQNRTQRHTAKGSETSLQEQKLLHLLQEFGAARQRTLGPQTTATPCSRLSRTRSVPGCPSPLPRGAAALTLTEAVLFRELSALSHSPTS